MSSYIGVYDKEDNLLFWISNNSVLGQRFLDNYDVPYSAYYDHDSGEIKSSDIKIVLSKENYNFEHLRDKVYTEYKDEENKFLAAMRFDKDFDSNSYREYMANLAEYNEVIGMMTIISQIISAQGSVFLQVS